MMKAVGRSIDANAPLMLPVPHGDHGTSPCGHGVWVETRFDAPSGSIALLVRDAELKGTSVRVDGAPVAVTASLTSARCAPTDEPAKNFLAEHGWFEDALVEHLPLMRARVQRAAAQRDRSTCRRALATTKPSGMIPYDGLYPHDWDFIVTYEGTSYWAIDQHCPQPSCPCNEVTVMFYSLESSAQYIGKASRDLRSTRAIAKGSTPLATQLFANLWARERDELIRRRAEVRAEVLRSSLPQTTFASTLPTQRGVSRSSPCPCGSGKKYKRCCADADSARAKLVDGK